MFKDAQVDFLAIGHICHDLVPGGKVIGGAAAYAAATAQALGCRAAVVTSASATDDWRELLPGVLIEQRHSASTTTFENVYTPAGRIQTLHAVADRLCSDHVPPAWLRAPIALLAPVANEVAPELIHLFSNSLVGIEPQGWMRRWGADGRVFAVPWDGAPGLLELAAVTFMSAEDLADLSLLDEYRRRSRLLVLTDGSRGCIVYLNGEERQFLPPTVDSIETTGAGDIFAAAYMTRLHQTGGDPWEAARFANLVASQSVTASGLGAKIDAVRRAAVAMSRSEPG